MKILFVSHEVAPFAKVGGLADVAGSLPQALKALGHDVRVVMPGYRMILEDPAYHVEPIEKHGFSVYVGPGWHETASLWQSAMGEVPIYFIGNEQYFGRTVNSATVYQPGYEQHLFFARAVLDACQRLDWVPDLVHCNDWHTGFLPVFLRKSDNPVWEGVGSVFTIHNLAYQGEFGFDVLERAGLPPSMFNHHELEAWGSVNFLKAGAVFSDKVNTVSERYAEEIQEPEYGCRLEGLMVHLKEEGRLSGILNGIDQDFFDPTKDPHLLAHFSPSDLSGKAVNKRSLLHELGFPGDGGAPLVGVVSRLSNQKGMDLMLKIADQLLDMPARLVVQGLGDPWLAEQFRALQLRRPDRFRFVEKFDPDLAQRVYAGSDIFLMPSAFEPCGLGQMIAMRYGTIPVVRETGGLADTVQEDENGFVFHAMEPLALLQACGRAIMRYRKEEEWAELVRRAMMFDSSWTRSAAAYEALYTDALEARHASAT